MRNRLLQIIALLFVLVSAALFIYPSVSKKVVQGIKDAATEQFDEICEVVQDGDRQQAIDDGVINGDGYLLDENGEIISDYPVVFQKDIDRLYQDSLAYNESLKGRQDLDVDFSEPALILSDYGINDGIYGYVSAPSIGLNMPIYLTEITT